MDAPNTGFVERAKIWLIVLCAIAVIGFISIVSAQMDAEITRRIVRDELGKQKAVQVATEQERPR
jgi:uncharacterized membrane protein YdfJ with MMPL/SSD domain